MAIQLFGANLDDYLHLLLPPIVKLFDAPDVPLPARKSVWKSSALIKLHKKYISSKTSVIQTSEVVKVNMNCV